jgi:hypothetical protein
MQSFLFLITALLGATDAHPGLTAGLFARQVNGSVTANAPFTPPGPGDGNHHSRSTAGGGPVPQSEANNL